MENVNLESGYERDQNILDPISFDSLLLEISCNCPDKTEEAVRKQFEDSLNRVLSSAREIFNNNLKNIVNHANR